MQKGSGWPHESGVLGQGLETLIQGPDNKNKDNNSKWVCGTCRKKAQAHLQRDDSSCVDGAECRPVFVSFWFLRDARKLLLRKPSSVFPLAAPYSLWI